MTDRWFSERLQQPITLARWGHFGTPVLIFPTAGGDAEEIERMRLIAACSELVEAGRVKLYSCDSVAGKAMVAAEGTPAYRMWLMNQFHDCVVNEIVPAIHSDLGGHTPAIITAGASIGAFNSLAVMCRYPHVFGAAICMSGTYNVDRFYEGEFTDQLYLSSPVHFLPGLEGSAAGHLAQPLRDPGLGRGGLGEHRRVVERRPGAGQQGRSRTGSTPGETSGSTTGAPGARCSRATWTSSADVRLADRRRLDDEDRGAGLDDSGEGEAGGLEQRGVLVDGPLLSTGTDQHVEVGEGGARDVRSVARPAARPAAGRRLSGIAWRQTRRISIDSASGQSWMIGLEQVGVSA